jgi:hypothetical protein
MFLVSCKWGYPIVEINVQVGRITQPFFDYRFDLTSFTLLKFVPILSAKTISHWLRVQNGLGGLSLATTCLFMLRLIVYCCAFTKISQQYSPAFLEVPLVATKESLVLEKWYDCTLVMLVWNY